MPCKCIRVVHSLLPNSDGESSEELFKKIKSHRSRGRGKEEKQKETRASRAELDNIEQFGGEDEDTNDKVEDQ